MNLKTCFINQHVIFFSDNPTAEDGREPERVPGHHRPKQEVQAGISAAGEGREDLHVAHGQSDIFPIVLGSSKNPCSLQEIIRLKYPTTLQRLQDSSPLPTSEFGLVFSASRPIILVGLGVFLPHGENIVSPLRFRVWVQEYAAQVYGPRGRTVAAAEVELSVREQVKCLLFSCKKNAVVVTVVAAVIVAAAAAVLDIMWCIGCKL